MSESSQSDSIESPQLTILISSMGLEWSLAWLLSNYEVIVVVGKVTLLGGKADAKALP